MQPDIFHLIFAGLATTVLLALGGWAGYWVGLQIATVRQRPAVVVAGLPAKNRLAFWDDFEGCVRQARTAADQGRELGAMADASDPNLPPELIDAIEALETTTRGLMERFQHVCESAATKETRPPPPQVLKSLRASLSPAPPTPRKRLERARGAQSDLSAEEISQFTGHADPGVSGETRRQLRHPYDCLQELAPWDGTEGDPPADEFVRVRCHDLSAEGFSFFWPDAPHFKRVLIHLGQGERRVLMAAEVLHSKALFMHGEVQYLNSCRFVRRLEASAAISPPAAALAGV